MDLLIDQLRRRDPLAADELHRRYYDRIHRFVLRLVGPAEAGDITQEVFLRVYRSIDDYEPNDRFEAWIYTIASHLCQDVHRRRRARKALDEGSVEARPGDEPPARLEREEMRRRLLQTLDELPFEQRRVFLLREDGRLTFREIAQRLGLPLGTVLARMKYAMDRIKSRLNPHDL